MPKAYVLAFIDLKNPEGYREYADQVPAIVAAHGGRYLVRGGHTETLDGETTATRHVVMEFPDRVSAEAFYRSEEYQLILPIRLAHSDGFVLLVDGVPAST